jgi:2,5-furandicarboxylate decarboxylase 1
MYEKESFRDFVNRLRNAGELMDMTEPVDSRHVATLVDQSDKAMMFHKVLGYKMPLVSGIIRSRRRMTMAMGCDGYSEIQNKLKYAIEHPISPKYVETSPTREIVMADNDVDPFALPIPMSSILDGGPMITAGVTIAKDPEHGLNSGVYRFLVKEKNLTGIDIVTPNNLRAFAQRA